MSVPNARKTFLLICVIMTIIASNAQQRLKHELDSCKNEIKITLLGLFSTYKSPKYLNTINLGKYEFLPICEFDGTRILEKHSEFDLIKPRKDKSWMQYRTDFINDSIFVIPEYLPLVSLTSAVYDNDEYILNNPFFLMSQYALMHSKYCFALNLRSHSHELRSMPICYIAGNKLHVLGFNGWDKNGKIIIGKYDGVENYIAGNYDGVSNYRSLLSRDSLERVEYITDILLPRKALKASYFYYEKCYLADTLIALQAYLDEMGSMVKLTREQSDSLKTEIRANLAACQTKDTNNIVEFLGKDIGPIIKKILSDSQMFVYEDKYFKRRQQERELFARLIQAYNDWNEGVYHEKEITLDNSLYNPLNPLNKGILEYIFSNERD